MLFRSPPEIEIRHLTGIDAGTGEFLPDVFSQIRQALAEGVAQLALHGMTAENVTRVVFVLSETEGFSTCFPLLNDLFGRTCPATTLRLVGHFDRPGQLAEIRLVAMADQEAEIA
ncbi:hypothetical protein JCM25156A_13770 [Komagataeibacter kakiaceti JCM 25156]|uniref:endoribonuclease L-PSP n=1 Tax=Komagataeibacter kakiaceti TaxID=943261 RepID=UPI000AA857CE|nr:endoribonuclease L-PSP [Komagataeibacter kakiaceti]